MDYIINSNDYRALVRSLYKLILEEISRPDDIEIQYPKFVLMYEFFKLLRGEAFTDVREPNGDFQKEMYYMEDEILQKLKKIKAQLSSDNERAKFHMNSIISPDLKL